MELILNFYKALPRTLHLGWVDFGWLSGAHQDTLSLPLLNKTGGENTTKSLWVEIRTRKSLSNDHHGQNRLDLGKII